MNRYDWNKEKLEEAIANSFNYSDVLRYLNIPLQGNNANTLKRKIKEYNLDTSHFTLKGKRTKKGYVKAEYYLCENSNIQTSKLKNKLLFEGIKEYKCECCGLERWLEKPIILQLHHVDGNRNNNKLENLQLLCPNCHSQTDNYCGNANTEKKYCPDCGAEISHTAIHCRKCSVKYQNITRKLNIPDEVLLEEKRILKSNVAIARKYNISETCVRKRLKKIHARFESW